MSLFQYFFNESITVARGGGIDADRVPTIGSQSTIQVKYEKNSPISRSQDGQTNELRDKVITDKDTWEFKDDDWVWLPGANANNDDEAVRPEDVGYDETGGQSLSWAIF